MLDPAKLNLEDPAVAQAAYKQVTAALWRRGELQYKLHETQKKIYRAILADVNPRHFLLCSRRLGKTFLLVLMAFEKAIRQPNSRILYLAPHGNDAKTIAADTVIQLLEDCPPDLKPEYNAQDKEYRFVNGSILRLKGTNGDHAKNLRGGAAHLVLMDEVGFMDDLRFVLNDVVGPMTLTTDGKVILATTPPRSPGHESASIYEDYAGRGAISRFTLLDAPHITFEKKCAELERVGETADDAKQVVAGKIAPKTTTALREYFCEFVTDADSAVIKEFTIQAKQEIVREYPRPPFFDAYVGMDPGMRDRTGIVFGYWDFVNHKLVIEDEALLRGPNTSEIAKTLKEREEALWGSKAPLVRVSDVDLRLCADLWSMHAITVQGARKEDALGSINLLRNDVQSRTLVINPRCVHLIRQMTNATWNTKATDFVNGGELDSHYDLLSALRYLTRTVNRHRNPYPEGWWSPGGGSGMPRNTWVSPKNRAEKSRGLYPDTPLGRKLAKAKK